MEAFLRKASIAFAGGAVGAVAASLAVWLSGQAGIAATLGVRLSPSLSVGGQSPWGVTSHVVWGALWGLLMLVPYSRSRPITRGAVLSLVPSAVQLLFVFPARTPYGFLGFGLGALTPLFVVAFNAIWGIVAAFWHRELG